MLFFVFILVPALILAVLFAIRHPLITLLGSVVVFYLFYVVMPAHDPSAARFGNLDPTQASPTPVPVRRALPVSHGHPVRRAQPVP